MLGVESVFSKMRPLTSRLWNKPLVDNLPEIFPPIYVAALKARKPIVSFAVTVSLNVDNSYLEMPPTVLYLMPSSCMR